MKIIPIIQNKFWGIKDDNDKIILPICHDELSIYIFNEGQLKICFKSHEIYHYKNLDIKDWELDLSKRPDVIFLIKKNNEFFLLKWTKNNFSRKYGLLNIYKEFETLESFQLFPRVINKISDPDEIIYIDKFYKEIYYIGEGFFKVKVIYVDMFLNQIGEGDFARNFGFDNISWRIIDYKGNKIVDTLFKEVDNFSNGLCKVSKSQGYNFLNLEGKLYLNEWYDFLEYPSFDNQVFLAGRKSYQFSFFSETGITFIKTTDLLDTKELVDRDNSSDINFFNKIFKQPPSATYLRTLLVRIFNDVIDGIDVEEIINLDLYNSSGFLKRIGVTNITLQTDQVNVCEINSNFIVFSFEEGRKCKVFRHKEETLIKDSLIDIIEITQFRFIDKKGNFVNGNYYHDINFYSDNLFKVAKSFFQINHDGKIDLVDTSLDEFNFVGYIDFWTEFAGHDDDGCVLKSPILKYGAVNIYGVEVVECKYDVYEVENQIDIYIGSIK